MTPETPDNARPTPQSRPLHDTADAEAIARLEQALAAETRISAALRAGLDELRAKVEQLETTFAERLEAATRSRQTAETKLADQQQRLSALGTGREETMRRLADTRAELARVRTERDDLLKKLDRVEEMQTSTLALTEEEQVEEPTIHPLPSMDELMAGLDKLESANGGSQPPGGHLLARVTLDEQDGREMIAPELVFPDGEYGDDDEGDAAALDAAREPISRVLVYLDAQQPINILLQARHDDRPLQRANIHRVGRLHRSRPRAPPVDERRRRRRRRASRNGIKVNSKQTERQILHHGDVLGIGEGALHVHRSSLAAE